MSRVFNNEPGSIRSSVHASPVSLIWIFGFFTILFKQGTTL